MKKRLDNLLVDKGFFESRSKAQAAIMAGKVLIDDVKHTKAGEKLDDQKELNIRVNDDFPYVSRGALKLLTAKREFNIDFKDKVCMDVGASTGGFTDVMLKDGAKIVYSIDVGYNQLAYSLRTNEKVINLEKTNFRTYEEKSLLGNVQAIVGDLSFISLTKIYENASRYLSEDGFIVFLIKPQFEAGKSEIGKRGLVKDKKVHEKVIKNVIQCVHECGDFVHNVKRSDIKGNKSGNIEYLMFVKKTSIDINLESIIKKAVYTVDD